MLGVALLGERVWSRPTRPGNGGPPAGVSRPVLTNRRPPAAVPAARPDRLAPARPAAGRGPADTVPPPASPPVRARSGPGSRAPGNALTPARANDGGPDRPAGIARPPARGRGRVRCGDPPSSGGITEVAGVAARVIRPSRNATAVAPDRVRSEFDAPVFDPATVKRMRHNSQRIVRLCARRRVEDRMPINPAASMSGIQKHPGVCGGEACIRNTRHTVAGLVQWRKLGLSNARILEHHPDLTAVDLEAAWSYYHQHTEEIDQAIRKDEGS